MKNIILTVLLIGACNILNSQTANYMKVSGSGRANSINATWTYNAVLSEEVNKINVYNLPIPQSEDLYTNKQKICNNTIYSNLA